MERLFYRIFSICRYVPIESRVAYLLIGRIAYPDSLRSPLRLLDILFGRSFEQYSACLGTEIKSHPDESLCMAVVPGPPSFRTLGRSRMPDWRE